jgi:hypothetical protein
MATKPKGVQVSTTVSPELFAALEDHRWTVRKSKSEVVLAALEEYAANHGLINPPAEEAPADDVA